jgi:putative ABC transport system substrate-binding protein
MAIGIGRRQFLSVLSGAVVTSPMVAHAEDAAPPVIGLLQSGAPFSYDLSGFRQGLKEAGFIEGLSLAIEYRWANNDPDRLPELAADLVRRRVRVIVAIASSLSIPAAKAATNSIPIVFGYGGDPVRQGLVASLNRPGGNLTGIISLANELVGKQLGILHELVPHAAHFALLTNPKSAIREFIIKDAQIAASAVGQTIDVLDASDSGEIDAVFGLLANNKRVDGLVVSNDPFLVARRVQLAILAARHAVPAIYPFREQAEAGGLLSYGPNLPDRDREVGHYVGRILAGDKPADLPVQQSSKFELLINLETAKALGLDVPAQLLARADEVIE